MDKSWKAFERRLARRVGGRRDDAGDLRRRVGRRLLLFSEDVFNFFVHDDEAVVVLRLKDWQAWHGDV